MAKVTRTLFLLLVLLLMSGACNTEPRSTEAPKQPPTKDTIGVDSSKHHKPGHEKDHGKDKDHGH